LGSVEVSQAIATGLAAQVDLVGWNGLRDDVRERVGEMCSESSASFAPKRRSRKISGKLCLLRNDAKGRQID
jgi:hypothetical protein